MVNSLKTQFSVLVYYTVMECCPNVFSKGTFFDKTGLAVEVQSLS